ncbi:hypothetical protein [Rhizobium mayense]|uniref:Uncharacterized protein n=1 Tax=Rhizobium mayense TaxID=1312184 RepID=A0ABT7JU47_9HYPH|nr:hypothetical protein [Rhizobium mayense]MDL2398449.1 hypothetical protein [Rhizobium mayense]
MDIADKKVSIVGNVVYSKDGRTHAARGYVDDGSAVRDRIMLMAGGRSDRRLRVEIRGLAALPDLIASILLDKPEDDESAEEFTDRLRMRDEIAQAFQEAAARIRNAPRE